MESKVTTKPGKQPADHLPKREETFELIDLTIGEGEDARTIPARRATVQGLTLTVEQRRLEDYRVVRLMAKARGGDAIASVEALEFLIGAEQHDQVVDLCADEDGYVSQETVGQFTVALFEAIAPKS